MYLAFLSRSDSLERCEKELQIDFYQITSIYCQLNKVAGTYVLVLLGVAVQFPCVSIWESMIIGPYFFLNTVKPFLMPCIYDIPITIRSDKWFQRDGAPPHFTKDVLSFWTYLRKWIWRQGVLNGHRELRFQSFRFLANRKVLNQWFRLTDQEHYKSWKIISHKKLKP